MSTYVIQDTTLTAIADAIREKTGGTGAILTEDMANEILGIEAGGGSTGSGEIDALIEGTIIEVSSGATSVKDYKFYQLRSLTSASLSKATTIGNYAFQECSALSQVNAPNVTSVGTRTFYKCSALESVDFPNATTIGGYAFYQCKLTSAHFPNVTSVGTYSFNECKALTSAEFPKVPTVAQYMFFGCFLLESVDISSATRIDTYAFSACRSLKSVILRSETVCTLATVQAFNNCTHILGIVDSTYNPDGDKDGYIYVPASLVDSYKSATNWSTYASQIVAIPGEESTKLPTPTIMVDIGDLYINDYGNATTATIYWSDSGTAWDYLVDFDLTTGENQHVVSYDTLVAWLDENAGVVDGTVYLSVITHADGYDSSERSNSDILAL